MKRKIIVEEVFCPYLNDINCYWNKSSKECSSTYEQCPHYKELQGLEKTVDNIVGLMPGERI